MTDALSKEEGDAAVHLFRERFSNCPVCGAPIEFIDTMQPSGERTLDVLHPKPGCEGFEAFMKRLIERVSAGGRHGTLV